MVMRSAFHRVVRTLSLSVGLGSLVFTLLGLPAIIAQFAYLDPVYAVAVVAIFCGTPIALAAMSFRAPIAALRFVAITHAVSGTALLALWLPAMLVDELPNMEIPWLINMITAATCMAAISMPFLPAWVYLFGMATLSGFVRFMAYGGGDASIAFQDSVMIALISGFMMALLQLTVRAGVEQDEAATAAQEAAAATAAAETLERQRTRYHAFTHDDVLATLLAASHDGHTPSDVTKRSAQRTLQTMDQFRDDLPVETWLTVAELESALVATAAINDFAMVSTLTSTPSAEMRIPLEACDALAEALAEAMRNSLRHSTWPDGRAVHREARASRTATTIHLVVTDDGRGFNPQRVGIDRLGVRLSILQRVNSQPGGHATVLSSKGSGTTVTLSWSLPPEAINE